MNHRVKLHRRLVSLFCAHTLGKRLLMLFCPFKVFQEKKQQKHEIISSARTVKMLSQKTVFNFDEN